MMEDYHEDIAASTIAALMLRLKRDSILEHTPTQGIFYQIQQPEHDRSAHALGEIVITSSPIGNGRAEDLTLSKVQDFWTNYPGDSQGKHWILIEFKNNKRAILWGYALRSRPCTASYGQPRAWILSGSNDNVNWTQLDKRPPNNDLNGYLVYKGYQLDHESEPFRYIKLEHIGPNNNNGTTNYLSITQIELHGTLVDNQ